MSAQTPELQAQINTWRQEISAGTISQEECRKIIETIRGDRARVSQATSGTKAASRKKAAPNGDDLLAGLEAM